MTKLERKPKFNEMKQTLKEVQTTKMESSSEQEDGLSVPSHFKKYTIKERKIVVQQSDENSPNSWSMYQGPKNGKRLDLVNEGEEQRPLYIATDLDLEEEEILIKTFRENREMYSFGRFRT